MFWEKYDSNQINAYVEDALNKNTRYADNPVFGIPGSWLNQKVFPQIDFLKEAPLMRTMVENPNHIGCHTTGESEEFFKGTHAIEREVLRICAEEILNAKAGSYDGYIATGGTEGNIQGLWVFRNFLQSTENVKPQEIAVIYSEDAHYSMHKACNLLGMEALVVKVDNKSRQMDKQDLQRQIKEFKSKGIKKFVAVLTMGTTMFGSVDKVDDFIAHIKDETDDCMIHIDAAFGGFIYPFSGLNKLNFDRDEIFSFSLDGHKMLQSPYGTGIYLSKKPLLDYVSTNKASYVKGFDQTLCGSRSGAHAVSMWMIFSSYGSIGWNTFIDEILDKTNQLAAGLDKNNIQYFREEGMNVITVPAGELPVDLCTKYHWVSDSRDNPNFFKAVIMDHVSSEQIETFLKELATS